MERSIKWTAVFVLMIQATLLFAADPRCSGKSEEWSECSAHCQKKCTDKGPVICNKMCVPGCVCEPGLVRSTAGECVLPEECLICDDPNAIYSLTNAHMCQNTCAAPKLATYCKPGGPKAGCICKDPEHVKNSKGICVTLEECKTGCDGDPNASNITYSPTCIKTCDNCYEQSLNCDNYTTVVGCSCNLGFVLDKALGKCVTPNKCTLGCGGDPNAIFLKCGNTCPRTCDLPGPRPCPKICKLGGECGCKSGYVEGPGGRCILLAECPAGKCKSGEKWNCPKPCGPTLCTEKDLKYKCQLITQEQIDSCIPECVCNDDYLRDAEGRCIPRESCPVNPE